MQRLLYFCILFGIIWEKIPPQKHFGVYCTYDVLLHFLWALFLEILVLDGRF